MVLGIGTLAGVLIWLTVAIVDKKTDRYKANKNEIERLNAQVRLDERRIKMQEKWIAELNELQKDLRVFNITLTAVAPALSETIKSISKKHGLDIYKDQPDLEKPTGDLFELEINYTWEGTLEAVVGFLTDLQQQGVRYDIRTLNISPAGKNSGKLKGNMRINCAYTKKAMADDDAKK